MTERARDELESINLQLTQKILEVQSLQAELKQRVVRDVLTGLFNRRHLNEALPAMLALAVRDRQPLSVCIIDLDHFKAVNDLHGHLAGDAVLKSFGEMLMRRLRKSDVACRYGGEEFCVLMPRTDARAARRKVEAMLKEWRTHEFEFDTGTLAQASFSAGVVDSVTVAGAAQQLLQTADRCALQAKRLGRCRVVGLDATQPVS
jgi:diguanylate cyclase (GGDEF)-like protein